MRYLILVAGLLAAAACAEPQHKGFDICPDNQLCSAINQVSQKMQNTAVDIQYRYSDASGNGKAKTLDNGSVLYSGDKFTIQLRAYKSVYVYLYHFDTNEQLQELLSLSGHKNHLKTGDSLILPSNIEHFRLDDNVGSEYIYTIIADKELTNLENLYQQKLLGKVQVAKISKGIVISKDSSSQSQQLLAEEDKPAGRIISCQQMQYCQDSFEIIHVARHP